MSSLPPLGIFFRIKTYWRERNKVVLNGKERHYFARSVKSQNGSLFIFTYHHGLIEVGQKVAKTIELPKSPVFKRPRQIENATATKGGLWVITRNRLLWAGQDHFEYRPTKGVRKGTRFSSIVEHEGALYLGSTFNGIYQKSPGEETFKKLSHGLPREKYAWEEYFYDEIKELFKLGGDLYALTDYTHSLYRLSANKWVKVHLDVEIVKILNILKDSVLLGTAKGKLYRYTNQGGLREVIPKKTADEISLHIQDHEILSWKNRAKQYPYKKTFPQARGDLISLFINLDFITFAEMDNVARMLEEGQANALVINFKDDTGNLIYGSKLPTALEAKASMVHPKLKTFLKKVAPFDPYIIARLVVFKDYRIYKYKNHQFALKHATTGEPWKVHQKEYWVDPFSDFYVQYMLEVVKELQERKDAFGIDELQFDYIRFPSDPQLSQVRFHYQKQGWQRYDVLENFLSKLNEMIELPYSLDIYGYNGIYRMGNVIAQDIETISKYAPIICPMYYPSHFGKTYLAHRPEGQTQAILGFGTTRAKALAYKGTFIRPYLQAFSYGVKDYSHRYIEDQIKGVLKGPCRRLRVLAARIKI